MGVNIEVYTENLKDVNEKNCLAHPQFVVADKEKLEVCKRKLLRKILINFKIVL